MMVETLLVLWLALPVPVPEPIPDDPPLSDLAQFPLHDTAHAGWEMARNYCDHARAMLALEPYRDGYWTAVLEEAECGRRIWDALDDATTYELAERDSPPECWCHARLTDLKQLLGEQAYRAGQLPPPVPTHRFRRVD